MLSYIIYAKNLVIVESPAKAHTIEKYLGKDFHVLASVGHIRKDTKVDKETFDVTYEIDPDHTKIINELKKAAAQADTILARNWWRPRRRSDFLALDGSAQAS